MNGLIGGKDMQQRWSLLTWVLVVVLPFLLFKLWNSSSAEALHVWMLVFWMLAIGLMELLHRLKNRLNPYVPQILTTAMVCAGFAGFALFQFGRPSLNWSTSDGILEHLSALAVIFFYSRLFQTMLRQDLPRIPKPVAFAIGLLSQVLMLVYLYFAHYYLQSAFGFQMWLITWLYLIIVALFLYYKARQWRLVHSAYDYTVQFMISCMLFLGIYALFVMAAFYIRAYWQVQTYSFVLILFYAYQTWRAPRLLSINLLCFSIICFSIICCVNPNFVTTVQPENLSGLVFYFVITGLGLGFGLIGVYFLIKQQSRFGISALVWAALLGTYYLAMITNT
jgi:hypothetical protein